MPLRSERCKAICGLIVLLAALGCRNQSRYATGNGGVPYTPSPNLALPPRNQGEPLPAPLPSGTDDEPPRPEGSTGTDHLREPQSAQETLPPIPDGAKHQDPFATEASTSRKRATGQASRRSSETAAKPKVTQAGTFSWLNNETLGRFYSRTGKAGQTAPAARNRATQPLVPRVDPNVPRQSSRVPDLAEPGFSSRNQGQSSSTPDESLHAPATRVPAQSSQPGWEEAAPRQAPPAESDWAAEDAHSDSLDMTPENEAPLAAPQLIDGGAQGAEKVPANLNPDPGVSSSGAFRLPNQSANVDEQRPTAHREAVVNKLARTGHTSASETLWGNVQSRTAAGKPTELNPFTIETLALCRPGAGQNNYQAMDPSDLAAGQRAILYISLKNVHWQPSAEGFQSKTFTTVEICPPNGDPLRHLPMGTKLKLSTSAAAEDFVTYKMTIPAGLQSGDYELRVQTFDLLGRHVCRSQMAIRLH